MAKLQPELECKSDAIRASYALRNVMQVLQSNQVKLQSVNGELAAATFSSEIEKTFNLLDERAAGGKKRLALWLEREGETPGDRMARICRVMVMVSVRMKKILRNIRARKEKEIVERLARDGAVEELEP